MPTARLNGIDLWYERHRNEGPTVILTHGFSAPAECWPPIIEELKPLYDLVLYDVRMHGRSEVPDDETEATFTHCAADIDALMEHLRIERAHVAGVSMGGMISAQFACDFPQRLRSLSLIDTVAGNNPSPELPAHEGPYTASEVERIVINSFQRLGHLAEKYGMEEVVRRENRYRHEVDKYAHLNIVSLEEQDRRNYWTKLEKMTPRGFMLAARALRERPDLTPRTPNITAPTLVSCGEWDLFYPCAARDASLIPNRRFVTIRRAAHDTLWFQPRLWLQAFTTFIADVEANRDIRSDVVLDPEE